jgi:hypothetical protein
MNVEIPTALSKDHPWLLKPEHGPYFIIVKSYVRPSKDSTAAREEGDRWVSARELAEGLAQDIRETHRVQAFLYEYISEERKAEMRAQQLARQKAQTEYLAQLQAIKQRAQLQGFDWELPDNKIRMRKLDYRDQIGVLVGGFQSDADAAKALAILKTWAAPKNTVLLDRGTISVRPTEKHQQVSGAIYVNPYETAFVVPNPAITKAEQPSARPAGIDPYIVKLNEGRPYNLLKATKGWTLGVKSFNAPVDITNKDSDLSMARKWNGSKTPELLVASAEQAEELAKALRALKGPRGELLNLEAFVLHTRTTSLVTVGQYDAPDDPALLATKRLLAGITANMSADATGSRPLTDTPLRPVMTGAATFSTVLPIPIPKH